MLTLSLPYTRVPMGMPLIWSGMRIAYYHLTALETINVVDAYISLPRCCVRIRWRWETTHLVLLATP